VNAEGEFDGEAVHFEQPRMKMLEILHSINFKDIMSTQTPQTIIPSFNPDNFIHIDERGCPLYDIKDIYRHLKRKVNLEREKVTATEQAKKKKANILVDLRSTCLM